MEMGLIVSAASAENCAGDVIRKGRQRVDKLHARMQIPLMRSLLASFVLGALLAPCCVSEFGAAHAQQPASGAAHPPLREACFADVKRLCAEVHPGSGGVAQCLLAHKKDLSPACRDGLARVGAEHADKSAPGKSQ